MLLSLWDKLQLARVLFDRLDDVLEPEPEQGADRARLRRCSTLEGRVALARRRLPLRRPRGAGDPRGRDADVRAGREVALVGRSGSGKTTLIKCLAGLLEPTEGAILFDGFELETLDYRDLRRKIGFVLQENYLFDDTIAANIAFGEDEPDMDRVSWAARVANAARVRRAAAARLRDAGRRVGPAASPAASEQRIAIARASTTARRS